MKISKSYLKQLIKEEIEILKEQQKIESFQLIKDIVDQKKIPLFLHFLALFSHFSPHFSPLVEVCLFAS